MCLGLRCLSQLQPRVGWEEGRPTPKGTGLGASEGTGHHDKAPRSTHNLPLHRTGPRGPSRAGRLRREWLLWVPAHPFSGLPDAPQACAALPSGGERAGVPRGAWEPWVSQGLFWRPLGSWAPEPAPRAGLLTGHIPASSPGAQPHLWCRNLACGVADGGVTSHVQASHALGRPRGFWGGAPVVRGPWKAGACVTLDMHVQGAPQTGPRCQALVLLWPCCSVGDGGHHSSGWPLVTCTLQSWPAQGLTLAPPLIPQRAICSPRTPGRWP